MDNFSDKSVFLETRKASFLNRVLAKIIDIVIFALIVLVFQMIWNVLGLVLGLAYILMIDSLSGGRSIGKKMMGLWVIDTSGEGPIMPVKSLIRNLPLGVFALFASLPPWGWILAVLIGIPLILVELYLMYTLESGKRVGDVLADTKVLDAADVEEFRALESNMAEADAVEAGNNPGGDGLTGSNDISEKKNNTE